MPAEAHLRNLLDLASNLVCGSPGWQVVKQTNRLVQAIPQALARVMPPIGKGAAKNSSAWFTLDFWIQGPSGGLGVFWRSNPVIDLEQRNHFLSLLLESSDTGITYKATQSEWREVDNPGFSGVTVSSAWWPKGDGPSLQGARTEVIRQLAMWSGRVPYMVAAISGVSSPPPVLDDPPPDAPEISSPAARPPFGINSTPGSTPTIPAQFRKFRAQPAYTSIFEIYPHETRLYCTEDLYGDWNAPVLLMAKDAGSSRIFLPSSQGGRGWQWVHNPARPTNRNLVPLAEQLGCGKLYASFLGPLLRNDDQESGALYMDAKIRAFVKDLFEWTISKMPNLETVAVLGHEAWQELTSAIGQQAEAKRWNVRHRTGEPLSVQIDHRRINLVALYHPARITSSVLAKQAGWKGILDQHG